LRWLRDDRRGPLGWLDVFEQGCREGSFLGNCDVEAVIAFFSDLPTPVEKKDFPT